MNGQTRLLVAFGLAVYSISMLSPKVWARGLDQLQPSKANATTPNGESKAEQAKPKPVKDEKEGKEQEVPVKAMEANKTAEADQEKTKPQITDRFFLGTGIAWTSLSANKGGWHAGFASDIAAGFLVTKLMQERLWLYGTLRYLPIDVVVKHNAQEFRGIVESYLFGSLASYRQGKIAYQLGAEVGASAAKVYPLETYGKNEELDQSGVNLTLSTGMTWRIKDGVHLGGRLFVGTGTFTSIQTAANVSFSL